MRKIQSFVLLFVMLVLSASLASAQSLVDVAKKEKQRRTTNQTESKTKTVITDRELARGYGGLPTTRAPAASPEDGEGADAAAPSEEEDGDTVDETKTPAYWQNRVKGAKDKIARLEEKANGEDWGEGQGVGVDPMGTNNLSQSQSSQQELQAARSELEAIRAEARRAGAPPGWTR